MKPDWKDAPEWAQWLAQDEDATWWWYAEQPKKLSTMWDLSNGCYEKAQPPESVTWCETLEKRPDET